MAAAWALAQQPAASSPRAADWPPRGEMPAIYYANLHSHTWYSDAWKLDGYDTPADAFTAAGPYFHAYAVTDHGELLSRVEC